jgi:hypothetical protein
MSSTNRGAERVESDFYATPKEAFEPMLPFISKVKCDVWEPACGDGRLLNWMREAGIRANGTDISKPDGTNFLDDDWYRRCIVTNPPFSLAFEFCRHAVRHSDHVFLLLRLNFLASQKRREWFKEHEPDALFVLSDRPSFALSCTCKGKGEKDGCVNKFTVPTETLRPIICPICGGPVKVTSSDSCEYAWYYWGPSHKRIHHL